MIWIILFCSLDFSLRSIIGISYDNNIYKFSDQEIEEYTSGSYPNKYPIKTADDLRLDFSTKFRLEFRPIENRVSYMDCFIKSSSYLNNRIKDYWNFSIEFRQDLGSIDAVLGYSILPDYMIRYYRPSGGSEYVPCKYTRGRFNMGFSGTLHGNILTVSARYWTLDYYEEFDYYDSKNYAARFTWWKDFSKFLRPELLYEFCFSDAKGPIPDISYYNHSFTVGNSLVPGIKRISDAYFKYSLDLRTYISENSPLVDPIHSGRRELVHNISAGVKVRVLLGMYSEFFVSREFRYANSDVYPEIEKLKNYKKWTLGTIFYYRI